MDTSSPPALLYWSWPTIDKGRFERAKKVKLNPVNGSTNFPMAECYGTGKEPYHVTLQTCTCIDFTRSKKDQPCKHMIRLAMDEGIIDEFGNVVGNVSAIVESPKKQREFAEKVERAELLMAKIMKAYWYYHVMRVAFCEDYEYDSWKHQLSYISEAVLEQLNIDEALLFPATKAKGKEAPLKPVRYILPEKETVPETDDADRLVEYVDESSGEIVLVPRCLLPETKEAPPDEAPSAEETVPQQPEAPILPSAAADQNTEQPPEAVQPPAEPLEIAAPVFDKEKKPSETYEELVNYFSSKNLETVNKTSLGGSLYFFSKSEAHLLKKNGFRVLYADRGTKGTGKRPAWYIKL